MYKKKSHASIPVRLCKVTVVLWANVIMLMLSRCDVTWHLQSSTTRKVHPIMPAALPDGSSAPPAEAARYSSRNMRKSSRRGSSQQISQISVGSSIRATSLYKSTPRTSKPTELPSGNAVAMWGCAWSLKVQYVCMRMFGWKHWKLNSIRCEGTTVWKLWRPDC